MILASLSIPFSSLEKRMMQILTENMAESLEEGGEREEAKGKAVAIAMPENKYTTS